MSRNATLWGVGLLLAAVQGTQAATPAQTAAALSQADVWNVAFQQCGDAAATRFDRHPAAGTIHSSGRIAFVGAGYHVDLARVPVALRDSIAIHLHSKERGVDDSYVLFGAGPGMAPRAAYVVTKLGEFASKPTDAILETVVRQQLDNAEERKPSFIRARTPLGDGIEMIIGGRVASSCFPTSHYKYATSAADGSIGISHFVVREGDLIECSMVLPWPAGTPQSEMIPRAQAAMRTFEAALIPGE